MTQDWSLYLAGLLPCLTALAADAVLGFPTVHGESRRTRLWAMIGLAAAFAAAAPWGLL